MKNATLRKPRLYNQAYDALRDLIVDGTIRSGEVVSELRLLEMSQELSEMSRTPVREAVRRLIGEGLLEVVPGGLRVPLPTSDDFGEVYIARAALEGEATRIAATVQTPEFLDRLEKYYDTMKWAVGAGNVDDVIAANSGFHQSIVDFSGNKRIRDLLHGFEHIVLRYRGFALALPDHLHQSLHDHRHLIDLIRDGEADAAAEFARNHIIKAGGKVVGLLRGFDGVRSPPGPTVALLLDRAKKPGA